MFAMIKKASGAVVRKGNAVMLAVMVGLGAGLLSMPAGATSIYDPITAAVDFTDVGTIIVSIAALVAAVLVVIWAVKRILAMLKR